MIKASWGQNRSNPAQARIHVPTPGGPMPEDPPATDFLDDHPGPARDVVPAPPAASPETPPETPPVAPPDPGPSLPVRIIGIALAVMIGLAGAAVVVTWLLGRTLSSLNPFDEQTVDRSGDAVLVRLTDLRTYQAASGYYEIVIDQEKDVSNLPSFLAGERVLFVAAGSVDATVDFSGLGPGAVAVDPSRTRATIRLPAPVLGSPRLDLDRSYVADHQRGLKERLEDALGSDGGGQNTEDLYRLAEQRLAQAGARTGDLDQRARTSTRAMLTSLLTSLGFTDITVTFADEG
jgi:hypothetical protein